MTDQQTPPIEQKIRQKELRDKLKEEAVKKEDSTSANENVSKDEN